MKNLQELIDLITLEELDSCLFRGKSLITPWKRVFGGQVLAQALNAAYRTVGEDRIAHSLHGYFILPGNVDKDIIYQVGILRDGGSFSTRRVTASQNGKAIFIMAVSFQKDQDGFDHQNKMPDVKSHEGLYSDQQIAEMIKELSPTIYQRMQSRNQGAIEFRPVENLFLDMPEDGATSRNVWMKTTDAPDINIRMKHQILAYASDYDLLLSAVFPHKEEVNVNKLFLASLDHAMWFHRDFDLNDWLLYNIDSPSASNSRGMGYGRIFSESGALAATVMQEGFIRISR